MSVQLNRKFVKSLLGSREMTYGDLAEATGVSRQTVYKMMTGKPFELATLARMAAALHVTPSELISTADVSIELKQEQV
jgi:DNA-binding Xre family transcriptional regulator